MYTNMNNKHNSSRRTDDQLGIVHVQIPALHAALALHALPERRHEGLPPEHLLGVALGAALPRAGGARVQWVQGAVPVARVERHEGVAEVENQDLEGGRGRERGLGLFRE